MDADKTHLEVMRVHQVYPGQTWREHPRKGTIFHPMGFTGKMPRGCFGCKLYGYGIIVPAMEREDRKRRAVIGTQAKACATIILVACCPCASALNPSLDINQYAHTAWTVRDGSLKAAVWAIAQTPDGYLWLGTDFGLVRFDGVRFVPWQPPAGEPLPGGRIRCLFVARDGRLWIGADEGLASWKDGKLTH